MLRLGLLLIGLSLGLLPAHAQQFSKERIIQLLAPQLPPSGTPPRVKRAIVVEPNDPDAVIKAKADQPSLNMHIPFDYDSAAPTPAGISMLKVLGEAMQDARLAGIVFLVGGHTDARGSEQYNQGLSERRAQSVREHLIATFQISPDRLKAMGFGKRQPANPKDPSGADNRRVEIVNLMK